MGACKTRCAASALCDGTYALIGQTQHPLRVPAVGLLLWPVATTNEVDRSAYVNLVNAYLGSMRNGQDWRRNPLNVTTGWVKVAGYLAIHQVELWEQIRQPLDFAQAVRDAVAVEDKERRCRALSSIVCKVRTHLRLLALIISQGSGGLLSDRWSKLLDVFEHMLLEYSTHDVVSVKVDVSTGIIEAVPFIPERSLVEALAYTIDEFPNERRNEFASPLC